MDKNNCYRHEGYQQGFSDGKRTGGKINKKYVKNLFKTETQHLSNEESLNYKKGWQAGFTDAVNSVLESMVLQENFAMNQMGELATVPINL